MILTAPQNLRVHSIAINAINVTWDRIPGEDDSVSYRVYGMSSGSWVVISETKNNLVAITREYTAIKITAVQGSQEGPESSILPINSSNIGIPAMSSPVGMDESGNLKYLATTPEGVVKVTGATINNYGGDASAANQLTTINTLNTINTNITTNSNKLNSIITGLNSVSLSNNTINALSNINIGNFPNDYPDTATTNAINSLTTVVGKDTSLTTIANAIGPLIKTDDLNIDTNKNLGVIINNFPTDYPDAAASSHLSNISNDLINTYDKVNTIVDKLDLILNTETSIENNTTATQSSVDFIKNDVSTIQADTTTINSEIHSSNLKLESLVISNGLIATNTADLIKKTDLNIDTNKNLGVAVTNYPTDYPDSAALSELINIKNYLNLISSGLDVNIINALPAGDNLIGSVNVATSALPNGAATEASLSQTRDNVSAINTKATNILTVLNQILVKCDILLNIIDIRNKPRQKIFEINLDISNNPELRLLNVITDNEKIEELSSFSRYDIQIFSYAVPFSIKIREESSMDGDNFYHLITEKNLSVNSIFTYTSRTPIKNFNFKFNLIGATIGTNNNLTKTKIIIYAQDK